MVVFAFLSAIALFTDVASRMGGNCAVQDKALKLWSHCPQLLRTACGVTYPVQQKPLNWVFVGTALSGSTIVKSALNQAAEGFCRNCRLLSLDPCPVDYLLCGLPGWKSTSML
jgi:hypothetical protein